MTESLWTVVLAAGAGRRLARVTGGVPKQYWSPAGGASLLDQTLARFAPVSPRSHTVVVVAAAHAPFVAAGALSHAAQIVVQPGDRGTAAGVLLGILPVLASAPDALVAITPADHGIRDAAQFTRGVIAVAQHVRATDDLVVFGVHPTSAHDDYGWITPAPGPAAGVRTVHRFVEKPSPPVASELLASGAVWNTMVTVARARTLQALYARLLPDLAALFTRVLNCAVVDRGTVLQEIYAGMPRFDFSHDILTHAPNLKTYVWSRAMGWSDLGTPARLHAWQRRARGTERPKHRISAA